MPQTLMPPPPARERAVEPLWSDLVFGAKPLGLGFPRLFEDFFTRAPFAAGDALLSPATDVVEEDDALRVTLELPGLRKEDVRIELENGVLSVSGEKKSETSKKSKSVQRLERRYGAFFRSFALPAGVNGDAADAEFKDGVLSIRLPKREEAKPHAVKIR
jgi:HSP20 family protein